MEEMVTLSIESSIVYINIYKLNIYSIMRIGTFGFSSRSIHISPNNGNVTDYTGRSLILSGFNGII